MKSEFAALSLLLPKMLGDLAKSTTSARPLDALWRRIVGDASGRNSTPLSLEAGRLLIQTVDAYWAEALKRRENDIRARLNEALGQNLVQRLHFRVGA